MPHISCVVCNRTFYKRPWLIAKQSTTTCSRECASKYKILNNPIGNCICENCGKSYRTNPSYIKRTPHQKRFCSKECVIEYRHSHPNNLRIGAGGYLEGSVAGKYFRLHRKIMEEHLGRKLNRDEHVNHINGNKLDNRIENLEVLSHSEHMKLHGRNKHIESSIPTKCVVCGKPKRLLLSYVTSKYKGDKSKVENYRCRECYYKREVNHSVLSSRHHSQLIAGQ